MQSCWREVEHKVLLASAFLKVAVKCFCGTCTERELHVEIEWSTKCYLPRGLVSSVLPFSVCFQDISRVPDLKYRDCIVEACMAAASDRDSTPLASIM